MQANGHARSEFRLTALKALAKVFLTQNPAAGFQYIRPGVHIPADTSKKQRLTALSSEKQNTPGRFARAVRMGADLPQSPEYNERSNSTTGVSFDLREAFGVQRDKLADKLALRPARLDVGLGLILFSTLNWITSETATHQNLLSPEVGVIAAQMLSITVFAVFQQILFLPVSTWLRTSVDPKKVDPNPFFQMGSTNPFAGVAFAFIFAVPIAIYAALYGINWLPNAQPFPESDVAVFQLVLSPVFEEIFFRAWLLTALEGSSTLPRSEMQSLACLASATLFAIFSVPQSNIGPPNPSLRLPFYQAFGVFLSFLYFQTGGSLPLVAVTHCTFNSIIAGISAAQVGSTVPFPF